MEPIQNKIYLNRRFNCTASSLFEWLVQPDLISQWFGPKHLTVTNVQSDLKIGGTYSIKLLRPNGSHFFIQGEYMEIVVPTKLVFSLAYHGLAPTPPDSVVKIVLKSVVSTETELNLVQTFDTPPDDMPNRTKAWEHMLVTMHELIANEVN